MSVGGAARKGMNVSVPGRYHNSHAKSSTITRSPQQHSMEVQTRGKQLAAAGGSSATAAAATSSSFCYIAAATAAEPGRLAVSNLQQENSKATSSHTASGQDQHHLLQDSVPLGMVGFYAESNSATTREFFHGKSNHGNFQAVMEASSKAKYSEMEEDERQIGQKQDDSMLSSLQLRSPVPGDTASPSPCSHQNGVSLPPGGNPGKFVHNKSEFHLPDMPTSSAAGSPSSSCPINGQVSPTVLLGELVSPPSFQLNPVMYHKDTTSMDISTEGKLHDEHVICLWDSCHREFPSLARLVVHLDKCHTLAMSQFVCHWGDCPRQLKPFDARYKLTTHLRCHTGEKPYQCDISACKRSFSRLENLKLHTRTHTGEKPYQCHFAGCTKKFNNTSDRAKHMKTHITRKPYTCKHPGCNKSYTDPSSMRKHTNYTHKLNERDIEGGRGPALTALPRRKRNSTSCSSSSSNMPLTPQKLQVQQQYQGAILLNSPPTTPLHDTPHPILQTASLSSPVQTNPVGVTGGMSFGGCISTLVNNSTPQQIIPIVKLHGGSGVGSGQGQPLLLPTYQQQPLMMILPNSSTSIVSHGTPMRAATIAVAQNASCTQNHQAYSSTTTTTSSTSVEDQLRRQIAHLQQQLYRSQLAVAAAAATACTTTTTTGGYAAPSSSSQASAVGVVSHPIDDLNTRPHTQFDVGAMPHGTDVTPTLSPHRVRANVNLGKTGSLPETFALSQPPARLMATAQLAGGTNMSSGPTLVSSSVVGVGGSGGRGPMLMSTSSMPLLGVEGSIRPVPQFIPIPLIHSQGVTTEQQFLYMSP